MSDQHRKARHPRRGAAGWAVAMAVLCLGAFGQLRAQTAPSTVPSTAASTAQPAQATLQTPAPPPASPPGGTGSAFKPDAAFLKEQPFRKTKQVIRLDGVKSEQELEIVKGAINDVVGFVRLFGITGSNLGAAVPQGITPERVAEIKAARVTWKAFEDQSTPAGRSAMPIEPASGHMVYRMDRWQIQSDALLSVVVDFRQSQFELKPVKDPAPRVLRLRFVKQEGRWRFDGVLDEPR